MIAHTSLATHAQETPEGAPALDSGVAAAATRIVARLPQDQALGLRLLMLARTAAAVHMAESAARVRDAQGGTR